MSNYDKIKNFAVSTLASDMDDDDTSLTIQSGDGSKFPDPEFNCVIWNSTTYNEPQEDPNLEIVRVTGKSTNTFTISRAQEGTTAHSHSSGDKIELNVTAKIIEDLINKKANKSIALIAILGGI